MNGPTLIAARERLGLTEDQLAAELGLPPHAYRACEAGRATLPKRDAQMLAYRVAVAARLDALRDSGLPECAWIAAWDHETPAGSAELLAHAQRAEAHAGACEVCRARERFVRERFPELPALPQPAWVRAIDAVHRRVDVLPAWLRPAAWGALALAAMTSVRALLLLPGVARRPRALLLAAGAIGLAALAGALGGLAYGVLGRPLRRVPVAGPYLAGMVAVAGYMVGVFTLLAATGSDVLRGGGILSNVVILGVLSVFFGAIVGHQFLRPRPG